MGISRAIKTGGFRKINKLQSLIKAHKEWSGTDSTCEEDEICGMVLKAFHLVPQNATLIESNEYYEEKIISCAACPCSHMCPIQGWTPNG